MHTPYFIGHEIYRGSSYGGWHPLRVPRVSTVMDLARALGWLPDAQYIRSPRAKPTAIAAFHTPAYIAALQEAERTQTVSDAVRERHALGTVANPVFAEMYRRPATSSGGAILAGELLARGGTVYAPGCGTHHAMPDRANGFCYFNDPVLAMLALRHFGADHRLRRIAYVDIDAHHSDGVEHGFADDADTLQISVHEENRWPRTGALEDEGLGQLFNLPVPRGFNDTEMAHIRDTLIVPAVQAFAPDAVVLQCGADAVLEDPQSRLALSNNAHWDVVRALASLAPRYLVLGGGGYNPWSVGRLWTGVWGAMNGLAVPEVLPENAQKVLRDLTFFRRDRQIPPEPHWITTLRDAPRPGPVGDAVAARTAHLAGRIAGLVPR